MSYLIECLYCGHQWRHIYHSNPADLSLRCGVCSDKQLKITELEDYYDKEQV